MIKLGGKREKSQEKFKDFQNQARDPKTEQFIQENAKKAIEKVKREKETLRKAKKIQKIKKLEIAEEAQKIRESNMRYVVPGESRPIHAWGVDQRKFRRSPQENRDDELQYKPKPEKKFDEYERRERLGLGNLDEETLAELRRSN